MDRGAWQATVHGVTKSWTLLSSWACMNILKCNETAFVRFLALWICASHLGPGHEHFRDAPRPDHPPHDGHSPASRERSSSLQGMDMASLPPRKRPWHDGPVTSEHREMDAPGGPSEDRGGKGKWGWWLRLGSCGCYSPAKKASELPEAHPSVCLFCLSLLGHPPLGC